VLERAGSYLDSAEATWSQYQNLNGIGTEQRLESTISSTFRVRAKLLFDTHAALQLYRHVFARVSMAPGTGWKTLDAQVHNEISFQRRSLANLAVLEPATRRDKLALLPKLPD
jgi:hypothetical protein